MSRCNCFSLQLVGGRLVGRRSEPQGEVWFSHSPLWQIVCPSKIGQTWEHWKSNLCARPDEWPCNVVFYFSSCWARAPRSWQLIYGVLLPLFRASCKIARRRRRVRLAASFVVKKQLRHFLPGQQAGPTMLSLSLNRLKKDWFFG